MDWRIVAQAIRDLRESGFRLVLKSEGCALYGYGTGKLCLPTLCSQLVLRGVGALKGSWTKCNRFLSWRILGLLAVVAILATAAACGGEGDGSPTPSETPEVTAPTPTPPPAPMPTPPPAPTPTAPPALTPTPPPAPTPPPPPVITLPPAPSMEAQTEGLLLQVDSPLGDDVVSNNLLQVSGRASPGASVSINGRMANRGDGGTFTIDINLNEGPNLVEVIASGLAGNQREAVFLVVYTAP